MIVICAEHLYVICYPHNTFAVLKCLVNFLLKCIFRPKGILRNLNLPHGVLKVVRYEDSSSSRTFRNAYCASSLVNLVVPLSFGKISIPSKHSGYMFFCCSLLMISGHCEDQFQVECSMDGSGSLVKTSQHHVLQCAPGNHPSGSTHLQCHIYLVHLVNLKDLNEHSHVQHHQFLALGPETFLQVLGMLLPQP